MTVRLLSEPTGVGSMAILVKAVDTSDLLFERVVAPQLIDATLAEASVFIEEHDHAIAVPEPLAPRPLTS